MRSNILKAILKLSNQIQRDLPETEMTSNRIQYVGNSLEEYIRNAFLDEEQQVNSTFSYLGAKNSPPDLILRDGDAIEIKKLEGAGEIQLNSSFPKQHVKHNDSKLNLEAQNCETQPWQKDLIYTVGHVPRGTNQVQNLWFVYGDCYADKESKYLQLFRDIQTSVSSTEGVNFSPTEELGRVNNCDSQSNTNLRIRGMWLLKHPTKVFTGKVFTGLPPIRSPGIYAIMKNEKYNSFPEEDRIAIEEHRDISIVHNFSIPNPEQEDDNLVVTLVSFMNVDTNLRQISL